VQGTGCRRWRSVFGVRRSGKAGCREQDSLAGLGGLLVGFMDLGRSAFDARLGGGVSGLASKRTGVGIDSMSAKA